MAFTSSTTLELKPNASWTREERMIEKLRSAQRYTSAVVIDQSELSDLMAILQAVDDYAKGTTTGMNTIQTNYNAHKNDRK